MSAKRKTFKIRKHALRIISNALLLNVFLLAPLHSVHSESDLFPSQEGDNPAKEEPTPSRLEQLKKLYESAYDKAKSSTPEVPTDEAYRWLKQDVKNIHGYEYKIWTTKLTENKLIEQKLNALGALRWECIEIIADNGNYTFFMKRRKKSYLRTLPLKELLRLFPTEGS